MAMVTEFIAAINQICSERGIEREEVFKSLETAVAAAYKREYETGDNVKVEMDRNDGSFTVILVREVVEEVEDEESQISLEKAKKIQEGLEVGDSIEIEKDVEGFGRIAAQTAKQVIMQGIRESEKEAVLSEYSDKVGEVFAAMMHRMQGGNAVFEIGKAMVYMPPEEQVPNEFYRVGDRYKVYLRGIEETEKGKSLIVSRSVPEFLEELFRIEVPEIESGVVEIKASAREAGSRSKVAVQSHQEGVDPIGSCVGQRGVRIANVMGELGEEKIDVIEWREDLEEYVANALSPAEVISVEIENDLAIVKVEEDQLSLAIGRDGQNVRLAAKLLDMRIDIQGPEGSIEKKKSKVDEVDEVDENQDDKEEVQGLDEKLISKIEKAGASVDDVKEMEKEELMELDGIGKVTAEKILEALK